MYRWRCIDTAIQRDTSDLMYHHPSALGMDEKKIGTMRACVWLVCAPARGGLRWLTSGTVIIAAQRQHQVADNLRAQKGGVRITLRRLSR